MPAAGHGSGERASCHGVPPERHIPAFFPLFWTQPFPQGSHTTTGEAAASEENADAEATSCGRAVRMLVLNGEAGPTVVIVVLTTIEDAPAKKASATDTVAAVAVVAVVVGWQSQTLVTVTPDSSPGPGPGLGLKTETEACLTTQRVGAPRLPGKLRSVRPGLLPAAGTANRVGPAAPATTVISVRPAADTMADIDPSKEATRVGGEAAAAKKSAAKRRGTRTRIPTMAELRTDRTSSGFFVLVLLNPHDQVRPAVGVHHLLRHLADLERERRVLERLLHGSAAEHAQVAAVLEGAAIALRLRDRAELVEELLALQPLELFHEDH